MALPHDPDPRGRTAGERQPGDPIGGGAGPNFVGPDAGSPRPRRQRALLIAAVALPIIVIVVIFLVRLSAPATDGSAAESALAKSAPLLAGGGDAAALAKASCAPTAAGGADDEFLCTPAGGKEQPVRIIVRSGGAIAKRLSGSAAAKFRGASDVAAALTADAAARRLGIIKYACGTTTRMSPEGGMEQTNASGYLCVPEKPTGAGGGVAVTGPPARYVEPAGDGTVNRDYAITTP